MVGDDFKPQGCLQYSFLLGRTSYQHSSCACSAHSFVVSGAHADWRMRGMSVEWTLLAPHGLNRQKMVMTKECRCGYRNLVTWPSFVGNIFKLRFKVGTNLIMVNKKTQFGSIEPEWDYIHMYHIGPLPNLWYQNELHTYWDVLGLWTKMNNVNFFSQFF